ncbi:MAG: ribonuclease HIII [Haloferula sp.]
MGCVHASAVPAATYTSALTAEQAEALRSILERDGFEFSEKPYTLFAAKKGKLNVSVYEKGPKVLVQGKETEDFVKFTLEPEIIGEARLGYEEVHQPDMFEPHFGIDESGKGDYFGPLVIAGVYTDATTTRALMDAGIMDSKRITSAKRIRTLAKLIRETPGISEVVVAIGPERYNELHSSFGNVNRLLAWGHARAIARLHEQRPSCPRALSDQFAQPAVLERALKQQKIEIQLDQRTKAESDVAVAAASILARERFVDWMDKTSAASGVTLPLGASDAVIEAGKQLIERHGPTALERAAKTHFRTTGRILGD